MAAPASRRIARPEEEINETSRLNSPPDLGFSIPRGPVLGSSGQSGGMAKANADTSKGEPWALEDVHGDKRSDPAQRLPRRLHDWWLEMLSCVVFVGALMAIVGAILPYQDQPLPQWPYHVSVNTLVSILIVIAKAAMLLVVAEGLSQLKWTWFRRKRPLQDLARFDMAS
jgi:branched-subunit amino acid transport protein